MASTSAVSICNVALTQLGANQIHSLEDGGAQATSCSIFYENARLSCLARHPWNFAIRRVELPQDATGPLYQFKYQYTLPADCLRVLTLDGDPAYKAEGRKLLSDLPTCRLKYIADISDCSQWSAGFIDYLTARLRLDLAYVITKDGNQISTAKSLLDAAFAAAKVVDASEDISDNFGQFDSSLITVRF